MKKIYLLVTVLYLTLTGFAQTDSINTDRKIRFGFNIGANYSNLISKETLPNDVNISNGFGFSTGFIFDYSITNHFLFSPKAEISFSNLSIEYLDDEDRNTISDLYSLTLEFMVHLIYKIGKGEKNPYILIGPNFKLPITSYNKRSPPVYKMNPDFAIDFGIGFETRIRRSVFAPELRYSLGLLNISENPSLQGLRFNKISLIFNLKF